MTGHSMMSTHTSICKLFKDLIKNKEKIVKIMKDFYSHAISMIAIDEEKMFQL